MKKLLLLLTFAALIFAATHIWRKPKLKTYSGYNVVVILIDALRASNLGSYGYQRDTSPFMDELARKGVRFERAYSQESYTMASVPSIFGSIYPVQHKVLYKNPGIDTLADEVLTLPEILQAKGYNTAGFVFNPHLNAAFKFNQGFDYYDDNPEGFQGATPALKYETAQKIYDKTMTWLNKRPDQTKPFMLYLHYRDVHSPYLAPKPYQDMYCAGAKNKFELSLCRYDGEIRYTDDKLKVLVSELEARWPNTIFVICSDHGEQFKEHGSKGHTTSLYQEEIWVPLIVYIPNQDISESITARVENTDIAPTILDLLGESLPEVFEGISLVAAANNETDLKDRVIVSGGAKERMALIHGDYKYYKHRGLTRIETMRRAEEHRQLPFVEELYNLKDDPAEKNNIAAHHPRELAFFRGVYEKLMAKAGSLQGKSVELDKETAERLKSLGYM